MEHKFDYNVSAKISEVNEKTYYNSLKLSLIYKGDSRKIKQAKEDAKNIFPFANDEDFNKKKLANASFEVFVLEWMKINLFQEKCFNVPYVSKVREYSNIFSEKDAFKTYIDSLIPYSFGIWAKIKLTAPFYSADDDPFYPINPVLKEKVFKVPMLRGSGLKGALANVFKQEILDNGNYEAFRSFARIFGLGSNNFRDLITEIEKAKKNKQQPEQVEAVKKELIKFALFDLGIEKFFADSNTEIKNILNQIAEQKTAYLQPHKGRLIAYPLYFNRISLEVINPHNRKTRAGTQPIYYEVVPAGTTAFLQLVYIPYDTINTDKQNIEKQVVEDLKNITKALHILQTQGVGAKTKLGWGQFNIVERCTFCNNLPSSEFCNKSEN